MRKFDLPQKFAQYFAVRASFEFRGDEFKEKKKTGKG